MKRSGSGRAFIAFGLILLISGRGGSDGRSRFSAPSWQITGPRATPNAHSCDKAAETSLLAAGKTQALAIDQAQPNMMYAGGGIGPGDIGPAGDAGIYKSTDGGNHVVPSSNGLTNSYIDALWLNLPRDCMGQWLSLCVDLW